MKESDEHDYDVLQITKGDFAGVVYNYTHIKLATEENEHQEYTTKFII